MVHMRSYPKKACGTVIEDNSDNYHDHNKYLVLDSNLEAKMAMKSLWTKLLYRS